jgi:hypothetical protein
MLAIIYVICQRPRCNKCEYDGYDYTASCPTEQRHHITPETSVLSGQLCGQHLPEKAEKFAFLFNVISSDVVVYMMYTVNLCAIYKYGRLVLLICWNVVIGVKKKDVLE